LEYSAANLPAAARHASQRRLQLVRPSIQKNWRGKSPRHP
jgi:hypothetical protein